MQRRESEASPACASTSQPRPLATGESLGGARCDGGPRTAAADQLGKSTSRARVSTALLPDGRASARHRTAVDSWTSLRRRIAAIAAQRVAAT